jgi:hypothetical protein
MSKLPQHGNISIILLSITSNKRAVVIYKKKCQGRNKQLGEVLVIHQDQDDLTFGKSIYFLSGSSDVVKLSTQYIQLLRNNLLWTLIKPRQ